MADTQYRPVPGSFSEHAAQQFAGHVGIHPPHEVDIPDLQMVAANTQTTESAGLADNNQGIEIGKAQGQGRATSCVTLGVLIMVT